MSFALGSQTTGFCVTIWASKLVIKKYYQRHPNSIFVMESISWFLGDEKILKWKLNSIKLPLSNSYCFAVMNLREHMQKNYLKAVSVEFR